MPLHVPPPLPDPGSASQLLGDWTTPHKDIVQIYHCDTAICLRIVYVDPGAGHTTDGQNPDPARKDRPLCGLVVGTGFSLKNASVAEGGKLYDPESGHTYSGTLTLNNASTLKLHGFVGVSLFGRSETWTRAQAGHPTCK